MRDLSILWFRQDLRLSDNPALVASARHDQTLPIYIMDDQIAASCRPGAASRWWLNYSLYELNRSIEGKLSIYQGASSEILENLVQRLPVKAIYWNRCYEPWRSARDSEIESKLSEQNIKVQSYNGSLLWEPWAVRKEDGTPYKVFTPFYRNGCLNAKVPRKPLHVPSDITWCQDEQNTLVLKDLKLLPKSGWDKKFEQQWSIGEHAAQQQLQNFKRTGLQNYKQGRNFPAEPFISRLSPHLHFGEISPNQVWYAVSNRRDRENVDHFCSELGWREFSYNLLYQNPELRSVNLQKKFDSFPWSEDQSALTAWQTGMTGVPMVDAGMRELWKTGFMHNRVRMITGSFLVKNLLLDWRQGERWFWDTLVDADQASNSASWQWVAGCGADAAPYFRVFNPVIQGQKFDPDGNYVRSFIPELQSLPNKYLFNPWEAPESLLTGLGIKLGVTYPKPIVDLKTSRSRALEAFNSLKQPG